MRHTIVIDRGGDIIGYMGRVSQNPLSPEVRREITDSLIRIMVKIDDDALLRKFLDDLFTPVEKLMLAKRLMVSVLLQRGYSYGAICRALKMSKTTVLLIQRDFAKGGGEGYRAVFQKFFQKNSGQKVVGAIEKFLDVITLPGKGSSSSMRRWKRALRR